MPSRWQLWCAAAVLALSAPLAGQNQDVQQPVDGVSRLVASLQASVQAGDVEAVLRLVATDGNRQTVGAFAEALAGRGPATRVAIEPRDRVPATSRSGRAGARLTMDILVEQGSVASVFTCQLDAVEIRSADAPDAPAPTWQLLSAEVLSVVPGLERLTLDGALQYRATNLVVRAEDIEFHLSSGRVFVARSAGGVTAAVLLGDGEMVFSPSSPVDRGQVKIFSGSDTLRSRFDAAYLRFSPAEADRVLTTSALVSEPAEAKLLERASEIFTSEADRSYAVNLGDLSPDRWWVQPPPGDFVAEVRTRKHGDLSYTRSFADHEDVTLFDRTHRRHIATYASPQKLATRGRFYDESDGRDFQVLHYDVDIVVLPDRSWLQGRARLHVRTLNDGVARLSLQLADSLGVTSVSTAPHGRVLAMRIRNRNTIIASLPKAVARGTEFDVTVEYRGRLAPQQLERGRIVVGTVPGEMDDSPPMPLEPTYLYSNRSDWYPHPADDSYATASITLRLPPEFGCAASGELADGMPQVSGVVGGTGSSAPRRAFRFEAAKPIKYLAFVAGRFEFVADPALVPDAATAPAPPASADRLRLSSQVTPRFKGDAADVMSQAAKIAAFYESLTGSRPYPSVALALVEDDLPGGHSPAYLAVLHQVRRAGRKPLTWSSDPVAFEGFPDYVLAHELAHQWWGQAVGPKNYHEQWISEGFAQYFAALYAERVRGADAYRSIVRQLRRSAMDASAEGPLYLGSRLGHLRGDSRIYRSIVYNKGALVLHMLRLTLGDDAFFRAIRRFYASFEYRKAGSDDVRRVFEAEAGRPLDRFFEGWVYGEQLPSLAVTTSIESGRGGHAVVIRAEQGATRFDVPVPVSVELEDGSRHTVVVLLNDRAVERRVPCDQAVRRVTVLADELAANLRTS